MLTTAKFANVVAGYSDGFVVLGIGRTDAFFRVNGLVLTLCRVVILLPLPLALQPKRLDALVLRLARSAKPFYTSPAGPFVYRLGHEIFNLGRRVRLP